MELESSGLGDLALCKRLRSGTSEANYYSISAHFRDTLALLAISLSHDENSSLVALLS
jgi:hypothetical protein